MKPTGNPPDNLIKTMLLPANSKTALYAFIGLLFLSVLVFTEWPLLTVDDAAHKRMLTMLALVFPHALCGVIALVAGPFQFSSRLRKYNIALHRTLGKIY